MTQPKHSYTAGTPVMIVSDLDGTMVGDDSATTAFRNWVRTLKEVPFKEDKV